jgi:hypothetical protein
MHACMSFKESSSKWVRGPWCVLRWFPREIFFNKKKMLSQKDAQRHRERERENSDIYVWYGSGDHHHHAALCHTDRDIRRLSGFSEDSLRYCYHKKNQNKTKPNTQNNTEEQQDSQDKSAHNSKQEDSFILQHNRKKQSQKKRTTSTSTTTTTHRRAQRRKKETHTHSRMRNSYHSKEEEKPN